MTVHAHPDDEVVFTGGTLLLYRNKGVNTVLVTATGGEEGEIHDPDLDAEKARGRLGEIRREELQRAVDILRIPHLEMLNYRDSGMAGTEANARPDNFHNADRDEATILLALAGLALGTGVVSWFGFSRVAEATLSVGWSGFSILAACQLVLFGILGLAWYAILPRRSGLLWVMTWGRMVRDSAANCLPFTLMGGIAAGARSVTARIVPGAAPSVRTAAVGGVRRVLSTTTRRGSRPATRRTVRRGSSRHWLMTGSTSPASPASIACCARKDRCTAEGEPSRRGRRGPRPPTSPLALPKSGAGT